jgi:predicted DNA-binding antitoxin AbrB/MazE fold protein
MKKLIFTIALLLMSVVSHAQNLPDGALSVVVSNETPRGTNIPFDSPAVPFTTIELTASASEDVEISAMTFTRQGLGYKEDFDNVWLEIDGFKVSNDSAIDTNNLVVLEFVPSIVIPAGQTVIAEAVASLSGDIANINHFNRFDIASANNIAANSNLILGDFPISGEEMQTENYTVTPLEFTVLGANTNVKAGETLVEIGEFSLKNVSTTSKDIELRVITFKNDGSAEMAETLENINLYVSDDQVSAATIIEGDYVTFLLDNGVTGGYIIEEEVSKTFTIKADVLEAEKEVTINLKLEEPKDIIGEEIGTAFGVKVRISGSGNLKTSTIEAINLAETNKTSESKGVTTSSQNANEELTPKTTALQDDTTSMASANEEVSFVFSDVLGNHLNSVAIRKIKNSNIVEGYEDGTFKPQSLINRAEFTKIVIGAQYANELDNCDMQTNGFSDVEANAWFAPYICVAKARGIINGYPNGTFKPENNVKFTEAAKIVAQVFSPVENTSDEIWYRPFVNRLSAEKAIPKDILSFDHNLTRGQMAELIYRLKWKISNKPSLNYSDL